MQAVRQIPKHELVAACLGEGMRVGRWSGSLPGVARLAAELDVSQHTVRRALPLATGHWTGPGKEPAFRAATRQLLALGHRRIVLIVRASRRVPTPGNCERAFLEELAAHGIATSDYHLPSWEETPAGFSRLLERLF